jgi:hypothetical protein
MWYNCYNKGALKICFVLFVFLWWCCSCEIVQDLFHANVCVTKCYEIKVVRVTISYTLVCGVHKHPGNNTCIFFFSTFQEILKEMVIMYVSILPDHTLSANKKKREKIVNAPLISIILYNYLPLYSKHHIPHSILSCYIQAPHYCKSPISNIKL